MCYMKVHVMNKCLCLFSRSAGGNKIRTVKSKSSLYIQFGRVFQSSPYKTYDVQVQANRQKANRRSVILTLTQQTHNVAITSLQRRCNVVALQRRCNDVEFA